MRFLMPIVALIVLAFLFFTDLGIGAELSRAEPSRLTRGVDLAP